MARVEGIKKSLIQNGVDEKTMKEIIGNGNLVNIIERMENMLDPDIMHRILDSHACGGGKDYVARLKKIGREIASKTVSEKVAHVNSLSSESEQIILREDNTLSVLWSYRDGEKYRCLCSAIVIKGVKVSALAQDNHDAGGCVMPLSYCYCCAGSGRRHLQLQLGVELKTKEVMSTPINSKGKRPCEIIYQIL